MRRTRATLLALIVITVLVVGHAESSLVRSIQASRAVPTPEGQLGGPEPLATDPVPPAGATTTPVGEESCDVQPLTIDEIAGAAGRAVSPAADAGAVAVPASAAQAAAARQLIDRLIVCANRNDPARLFALFTPDGIARSLQRQGIGREFVPFLIDSAGDPLPLNAQAQLVSVDRVVTTAPDRLRGELTLIERSGIGEYRRQTYVAVIAAIDGSWLIDDILPASPGSPQ